MMSCWMLLKKIHHHHTVEKYIKIKYVTQLPVYYPSFVFYCNYPDHVKPSYRNFIENQLRKNFTLTGVFISVYFREK